MIAAEFHKMAVFLRGKRLSFLRAEIGAIPKIKIGKRTVNGSACDVIREYTSNDSEKGSAKRRHQYDIHSKQAQPLIAAKNRRDELSYTLSNLKYRSILDAASDNIVSISMLPRATDPRFTKEEFDKLVELNEQNPQKKHYFDGHVFRSKSELIIAQYLKFLGLEYKYEVIVQIGEQTYYTDFAVYCPETGRFFLIEHLGMMSKDSYRMKNFAKITNYTMNGYIEGIDVLFIYEHGEDVFSADAICGKILGVIVAQARQIARESVI